MIGLAKKEIDILVRGMRVVRVTVIRCFGRPKKETIAIERQTIERHAAAMERRDAEAPVAIRQSHDDVRSLGSANERSVRRLPWGKELVDPGASQIQHHFGADLLHLS